MRRIDRGPPPRDEQGNVIQFKSNPDAASYLRERIGDYCSYCERTGDLHLEHVIPVSLRLDLEREWSNFLLGCRNCNSIKSNNNESRNGYLWPDRDDTESAFEYLSEGRVRVRDDLPEPDRSRARALYHLVGLGRRPRKSATARDRRWLATDRRWLKRQQAWRKAEIARQEYMSGKASELIVTVLAQETGFWSVWMTVFENHPKICGRLRRGFPGTR